VRSRFKLNAPIVFILFLGITLLIYGTVISGPFLFDDNLLIELNLLIRSLDNFSVFFTSHSLSGASIEGSSNFYRPMQYLAYAIIYHFFGLNAIAFHCVSIFLHFINANLLFLFLQKLRFSYIASAIAAIVFIVHPVNLEAVSYISGIADPLGFFFLFLGFLRILTLKKYRLIDGFQVTLLFSLALLSKESTLIFLPLTGLIIVFMGNQIQKEHRKFYGYLLASLVLLASGYLTLKFTVLNFTGTGGLNPYVNIYTQHLWVRITTFISILHYYVELILFPRHLYIEKSFTAYTKFLSPQFLFGIFVIISGLWLSYRSFFRKKIIFFGFFWFFLALVPVSGLIPLNAVFLEHWLYFPIVGVLILLAGLWDSITIPSMKIILSILVLVFIIALSTRSILRNREWADPILFYQNELAYSPNSTRIHNNLGMEYSNQTNHTLAIKSFKTAISIWDNYPQTHHNLADTYREQGDFENAELEYLKALQISPSFIYSHIGLFKLYEHTQPKKATQVYNRILELQNE
jgi:hypothetical protein